jgi:hypothetical protein
MKILSYLLLLGSTMLISDIAFCFNPPQKKYSWQMAQAKATAEGDLVWTPAPFVFKTGKSIRYIDFEDGDDRNSGTSKSTPWKHHPWDPNASAESAKCKGIQTFVFTRGSVYRGAINVRESGE